MKNVEKLIYPSELLDFIQNNWTRLPHLAVKDNVFEDVITVDEINEYLSSDRLSYPFVKVIGHDGLILDHVHYVNDKDDGYALIDRKKFFKYYSSGHSVVLQTTHLTFNNLRLFVIGLENETKMRLHANIYITPPSSKAFNPHFDAHEVFVIQVSGTKNWNLYDMPYQNPGKGIGLSPEQRQYYMDIDPQHKVTLSEGDVLYIPRGVVHDAYTTDSTSIHITIGMHPIQGVDIVRNISDTIMSDAFFTGNVQSLSKDFDFAEWKRVALQKISCLIDNSFGGVFREERLKNNSRLYFKRDLFYELFVIDNISDYTDFQDLELEVNNPTNGEEENSNTMILDLIRNRSELTRLSIFQIKENLKKLLIDGEIKIK